MHWLQSQFTLCKDLIKNWISFCDRADIFFYLHIHILFSWNSPNMLVLLSDSVGSVAVTWAESNSKSLVHLAQGAPTPCVCDSAGLLWFWWHSYVSRVTRRTRSRPHSLQHRPRHRPPLQGEGLLHSRQWAQTPLKIRQMGIRLIKTVTII